MISINFLKKICYLFGAQETKKLYTYLGETVIASGCDFRLLFLWLSINTIMSPSMIHRP